jgi:hypothetical protein
MNTRSSRLLVVDFTEGFNPLEDTFDGNHPNNTGSEKMAQKWFEGILEVLKKTGNPPLTPPSPTGGEGLNEGR